MDHSTIRTRCSKASISSWRVSTAASSWTGRRRPIVSFGPSPTRTPRSSVTGRQLLRRPGYEIDVEKVLRACAKYGVAVEINAHPWRLDLDWRWHQAAL